MDDLVRVRLDVQGMKHSIVRALTEHQQDIQDAVERAVERVVREFDFAAVAREKAEQMLRKAMEETMEEAARAAMREKHVRDELLKAMSESFVSHMAKVVSRRLGEEEDPPF